MAESYSNINGSKQPFKFHNCDFFSFLFFFKQMAVTGVKNMVLGNNTSFLIIANN